MHPFLSLFPVTHNGSWIMQIRVGLLFKEFELSTSNSKQKKKQTPHMHVARALCIIEHVTGLTQLASWCHFEKPFRISRWRPRSEGPSRASELQAVRRAGFFVISFLTCKCSNSVRVEFASLFFFAMSGIRNTSSSAWH